MRVRPSHTYAILVAAVHDAEMSRSRRLRCGIMRTHTVYARFGIGGCCERTHDAGRGGCAHGRQRVAQ
eukprot:scaffold2610_cov115-Isochrysis_galbana.AAC.9